MMDIWLDLVGGFNHLEKYEFVNGKDDIPIYYGTKKRFETTSQSIRIVFG